MTQLFSSKQVAAGLGMNVEALQRALWKGRAQRPQKSPAGNFIFTLEDIERIAWALHRHDAFEEWQSRAETTMNGNLT